MRRIRGVVMCFFALLGAGSCAKQSPAEAVTQAIGHSGGTVRNAAGDSVAFPAGALRTSVPITVAPWLKPQLPTNAVVVGAPMLLGPEGTQFAQPATVTLSFDPTQLPPGTHATDVVIMTAPAGSEDFVSLGGTLVDSTHVSASTTHFSVFVPAVAPPSGEGSTGSTGVSDPATTASGSSSGLATNSAPSSTASTFASTSATETATATATSTSSTSGFTTVLPATTATGTSGSTVSRGTSSSTTSSGPSATLSSCDACTAGAGQPGTACVSVIETCTADPACNSFANCGQACTPGDNACLAGCESSWATGASEYGAVISCLCTTECPSECALECGSASSGTSSGGSTAASTAGGTSGRTGGTSGTGGTSTAGTSTGGTIGGSTSSTSSSGGSTGSAVCAALPFVANGDIGVACDPDAGSPCAAGEACLTLGGVAFCSRDCTRDGACPGGICLGYDGQGDAMCFPDCINGSCPQPGALGCYALTPNPLEPGVCFPGCASDAECNTDAGTSFTCTAGTCRCTADADCGGGRCDTASGSCYLPCSGAGDTVCGQAGAGCCAEVPDAGVDYCDVSSWPTDNGGTTGSTGTTGSSGTTGGTGSTDCGTCATAAQAAGGACAAAVASCNADPSCAAFWTCLQACSPGDNACVNACATTDASGVTTFTAIGNCLCGAACGTACASECSGGP